MADILATPAPGKLAAASLTAALVAASTPATFSNDGQMLLFIRVGATPTNLTINMQPCSHGRTGTTVLPLLANTDYLVGPFPQQEYNDSVGKLNLSFSSIATVSVAVLKHGS